MTQKEGNIRLVAPAKVNLILKVLDRLPNGYHRLWSLMHTVKVEDEVDIQLDETRAGVHLRVLGADLPADQSNLVYRAAEAVLQQVQVNLGVEVVLRKRIPMGAGLGGGSSDAAATIVGLTRLLGLGWSTDKLVTIGASLGSDIPFFFSSPSAVVQGVGEEVVPVTVLGKRWIVLVHPGFPIQTKWAYERLAASRSKVPLLPDSLTQLSMTTSLPWESLEPLMANDFEGPVFSHYPVLREIKKQLLEAGAKVALLSGSGSTMFGLFDDEETATQAMTRLSFSGRCGIYPV